METLTYKILNIMKKLGIFLLGLFAVLVLLALIYYGIDFVLKDAISSLSRAVLANFVVFALVIGVVLRQAVHPKAILEQAQTIVENEIKDSEKVKEESEERLTSVQKSARNVKKEINAILKKSEENAQLVGAKILEDAEKTALVVQETTEKAIENNQLLLKNDLIKRASLASIEVAKAQIINELNNNRELHDKLIDESIEAIVIETKEVEEV